MTPPVSRRRLLTAAVATPPAVLLGACGTGPATAPPSGVDELTVPTPTPDPADFVADVDNPWWPLVGGTTRVYGDATGRRLRRTVGGAPERVGGVPATGVRTEAVAATWGTRALPSERTSWFAQDRRRNVWLVGGTLADGSRWEAGVDGAEAGLVVTGVPRVGDGYVRLAVPGLAAERVRVREVGEVAPVAGQDLEVLLLEVTTGGPTRDEGRPRAARRGEELLARGVGLARFDEPGATWTLRGP
ncbi:hypothetical protein INN71_08185 [Nocardioides sp. ChNu-153]|uniref:hypothetical protein n=1 Tax=unclassified Nocardioides TaxID=2615069 RepID=UPI002405A7C5|nr:MULTISPECIES: hypothetical protein [unclassified Nocardioides]MDF9717320.1 hypothetical protein [Nocardioides sp. ChNu-99]MDN7121369.1 hypothetical protein [Nocardioides sp. ChNu-153]